MVLVGYGLNNELVSLMRPIYTGINVCTKTSGLNSEVVLISSGLYSGTLLYYASERHTVHSNTTMHLKKT